MKHKALHATYQHAHRFYALGMGIDSLQVGKIYEGSMFV